MSKTAVPNIDKIRNRVQTLLDSKCKERDFRLEVSGHGTDEEWVLVVVEPTESGIRAYDYVEILSEVEKDLRDSDPDYKHVLLVPTLPA